MADVLHNVAINEIDKVKNRLKEKREAEKKEQEAATFYPDKEIG